MSNTIPVHRPAGLRTKYVVFAIIAAMTAYVLYHNERFLIDWKNPAWQHYETFKWWLLPHGVVGAAALLLAPMQFSDRLRNRYKKLHRIVGRIYVFGAIVFAPLGAYIAYVGDSLGPSTSLPMAGIVDAAVLLVVTGIGYAFALKRMIPQHRQWMTRSYAVALVFFEVRVILGVTGWDQPPNIEINEAVVWTCMAFSLLIGDLANQWYELPSARPRSSKAREANSHAISAVAS